MHERIERIQLLEQILPVQDCFIRTKVNTELFSNSNDHVDVRNGVHRLGVFS